MIDAHRFASACYRAAEEQHPDEFHALPSKSAAVVPFTIGPWSGTIETGWVVVGSVILVRLHCTRELRCFFRKQWSGFALAPDTTVSWIYPPTDQSDILRLMLYI